MKLLLLAVFVLSYFYSTYAINGGMPANKTDFKYVVAVIVEKRTRDSASNSSNPPFHMRCTGGIIHIKFILSAAHCFVQPIQNKSRTNQKFTFKKHNVKVIANIDNVWSSDIDRIEMNAKTIYFVKNFFLTGDDDIAVVELTEGLPLTYENDKLTLPESRTGTYRRYKYAICLIASFGFDIRARCGDGDLKKMYSKIIPYTDFKSFDQTKYLLGRSTDSNGNRLENAQGICDYDDGAPVVLSQSPTTIIGIAIKPAYCCDSRGGNSAEVYTRVTKYKNFIDHALLSTPEEQSSRQEYKSYSLIEVV